MSIIRKSGRFLAIAVAATASAVSVPALAQTATNQWSFTGNTCGGTGGINNCYATTSGTVVQGNPGTAGSSPLIARIDATGNVTSGTEISTLFPSVDAEDFQVNYDAGTNSLSWLYTPEAGDPAIHYVGISQADMYDLFYYVGGVTSGTINLSTYFANNPGWSHIDFYDTGAVPEPATWAMMLLGFAGIGWSMRRVRARKAALA